jgi:hypothetical protein
MADLSPVTRAVLAAMRRSYDHEPTRRAIAADILRALADHQSPAWDGNGPLCHWSPTPYTRNELRIIAAELEGTDA